MSKLKPIDRSSFEPPYAQVARGIRERIMTGEYRPGDRLPSEAELCELYGVSPMTVRRAVTLLVQDQVAVTEHGRGTFVKAPELGAATFDLSSLRRYLDDAATDGEDPRGADRARVAEGRPSSSPSTRSPRLIAIKRILSSGGEAVLYHSEYLIFDPRAPARRGGTGA